MTDNVVPGKIFLSIDFCYDMYYSILQIRLWLFQNIWDKFGCGKINFVDIGLYVCVWINNSWREFKIMSVLNKIYQHCTDATTMTDHHTGLYTKFGNIGNVGCYWLMSKIGQAMWIMSIIMCCCSLAVLNERFVTFYSENINDLNDICLFEFRQIYLRKWNDIFLSTFVNCRPNRFVVIRFYANTKRYAVYGPAATK